MAPYQLAINKMGRATTGNFRSTPLGIALAESKLAPAKPLLDCRQAKFMQRLMARPKGHHGPEENLERKRSELTERLWQSSFLELEEKPEELEQARHRSFLGEIKVEDMGEAYHTAKD